MANDVESARLLPVGTMTFGSPAIIGACIAWLAGNDL